MVKTLHLNKIKTNEENMTSTIPAVNSHNEESKTKFVLFGRLCSCISCLMSILCIAGIVMFFVQLFKKSE